MKRLLIILLLLSLVLSFAACGGKADTDMPDDTTDQKQEQDNADTREPDGKVTQDEQQPDEPNQEQDQKQNQGQSEQQEAGKSGPEQPESVPSETPDTGTEEKVTQQPTESAEQTPEETPEPEPPEEETPASSGDPLSVLSTVWSTYSDEEKFPSTEPLGVDVSDTDFLSYQLTFPADDTSLIDSAAALMHMMNMNTFTCGAFHAADTKNVSTLASDLRNAIQSKHWMCGFPEKLVIVTMDQYVISMYGNGGLIDTFRDKLLASYSDASVVYDEGIG